MKKPRILLSFILPACLMLSAYPQDKATERLETFKKGVNLSWLENYWNGTAEKRYSDYINMADLPGYRNDMALIAQLGFSTVRLPVSFDKWTSQDPPYAILKTGYFACTDSFVKWADEFHLNLIIDNHHGSLADSNVVAEGTRIAAIWQQVASRYKNTNHDHVFFEIYNEPTGISTSNWKQTAGKLIRIIRSVDPGRTIIAGGENWNSIQGLEDMGTLNAGNIIYTFHFYDPFLFTHQGAAWAGEGVSTTGIPYPYDEPKMPPLAKTAKGTWGEKLYDEYKNTGNKEALRTTLEGVKTWADEHDVPVFCGEWGSYNGYADPVSRCRHATDVISLLDEYHIPWTFWEWDQGFSFFKGKPAVKNIIPCMIDAYGLKGL